MQEPEQTCALRALSTGDQVGDCVALPCLCSAERDQELINEEWARRLEHRVTSRS